MKNSLCCILFICCALLGACKKEDDKTPASQGLSIISIWPGSGLKSIIVTINGKNFSGIREENKVKFNGVDAVVLEASARQLKVVNPESGTSGIVTVQVNGVEVSGPEFIYTAPPEEFIVSTFAGEGVSGSLEGPATTARFKNPEGVAIDMQGNLIITDRGNNRIRRISPQGDVSAIAGKDAAGFMDGLAGVAQFRLPWRSTVDAQGNIYVADRDNHRIRKIATDGKVSTYAGIGTAGFEDGDVATAKFNQPIDVVADLAGNLYVADNNNHRIRKISTDGKVTTVAGDGTGAFADGTGSGARFKNPSGIALDGAGNIWVADRLNHRIRKIAPDGVVTSVAGSGTSGFTDGAAASARFAEPYGIIVAHSGDILVADLGNTKIRRVKNGEVSTIAGTSSGFTDGPSVGAQFNQPTDLCVDADDNIYVADLGNHRIRVIKKK